MLNLLPLLKQSFTDENGNPLAGGKLWSYTAGTTTPNGTYRDQAGLVANTNPIILDGRGECDVWIAVGGGSYKFVLTDANDVVIWTVDNITPTGSEAEVPSGWSRYDITDGQAETELEGQDMDLADYSSARYECEIIRGTTVIASGHVFLENLNGTARARAGLFTQNHGVTFGVNQVGTVATLTAAASTGPGNGTIMLQRKLVPSS